MTHSTLICFLGVSVALTLIGFFSGSIGNFLLARPEIARRFDWLTAGVFTSLGIRLALSER
jgi:threonine/homoserine/homoserine lactone efflux protein